MEAKKEDRRVKFTKIFLKDSLIDLLETKNISKITIKEICEHADINRATFYTHFSDQYALLKSIEEDYIENILKDVNLHQKDMNNTLILTEGILNYIYINAKMSKLLLSDRGDLQFQRRIMALVHDGILSQLPSATPKDIEYAKFVSSYVIAGCVGVIQKWFESGLTKSPKEIAEIISVLALTSLEAMGLNHPAH